MHIFRYPVILVMKEDASKATVRKVAGSFAACRSSYFLLKFGNNSI
jgi:hypothetical protein